MVSDFLPIACFLLSCLSLACMKQKVDQVSSVDWASGSIKIQTVLHHIPPQHPFLPLDTCVMEPLSLALRLHWGCLQSDQNNTLKLIIQELKQNATL